MDISFFDKRFKCLKCGKELTISDYNDYACDTDKKWLSQLRTEQEYINLPAKYGCIATKRNTICGGEMKAI